MTAKQQQVRVWRQFCVVCSRFALLDDKMRQTIMLRLLQAPNHRLSVKELTASLPISQPAVSHHLKILTAAKLVDFQKVGLHSYYYLTLDPQLKRLSQSIEKVNSEVLTATKWA